MKQTCVKKTTTAGGREAELQNFHKLFPLDKGCSTLAMSTKSQSLFSTVVSSFAMFIRRLFLIICIKFDSYNCISIAFFLSCWLPVGLDFLLYLAMVLSVKSIRTFFLRFQF